MSEPACVVYCYCRRAEVAPTEDRDAVLERLSASKVAFHAVPDLCEMSTRKDPALKSFAESGDLRVAACFPRALKWIFHAAGASPLDDRATLLNMRQQDADEIVSRLLTDDTKRLRLPDAGNADGFAVHVILYEGPGTAPLTTAERLQILTCLLEAGYAVSRTADESDILVSGNLPFMVLGRFDQDLPLWLRQSDSGAHVRSCNIREVDPDGILAAVERVADQVGALRPNARKSWFPVIDYDRCENCMQCLSFCLFNVFAADEEGRVQVINPHLCKMDCPACSRVCPEVAIIFPKYNKEPINGDVVRDADLQRGGVKVDVSALLGGDTYESLRSRSRKAKKRFSTEQDESRALEERKRCLAQMQSDLDIPDEVLNTIPHARKPEDRVQGAGADTAGDVEIGSEPGTGRCRCQRSGEGSA